ncbi:hypothetical protein SeLEV6574_g08398 [Synchytrium endobioticum]|uniref:Uncharacterized protein n=1 Tax=Synchytrium endobioticum TaxID=286115 RepID=A0A507C2J7_9FUNG|nr:hypothetical protein SeLEV6574_g08398 [Synchytrium endobioticum]
MTNTNSTNNAQMDDTQDPFARFTIANTLAFMTGPSMGVQLKVCLPKLPTDGSDYESWRATAVEAMEANRLHWYINPDMCEVISSINPSDCTPEVFKKWHVHRENMLVLKRLLSDSVTTEVRRAISDDPALKTSYDLWEKIKGLCVINASHTKHKIYSQWVNLEFKTFKSLEAYKAAENQAVNRMKASGFDAMVTDEARINKIVSTLASTPHKEAIEASLLTAAKTLVQAWEILTRFENLKGSDALFGTMAKKALTEQALSRTTTSFHAKVGEPSVTSLKRKYKPNHARRGNSYKQGCEYCKNRGHKWNNHLPDECTRKQLVCRKCPYLGNHTTAQCKKQDRGKAPAKQPAPSRQNVHQVEIGDFDQDLLEALENEGTIDKAKMLYTFMTEITHMNENTHQKPPSDTSNADTTGPIGHKANIALIDSGSQATILNNKAVFNCIYPCSVAVTTMTGSHDHLIKGSGPVTFSLNGRVTIHLPKAFYAPSAHTNIIAFTDIDAQYKTSLHSHMMLLQKAPNDNPIRIAFHEKPFHVRFEEIVQIHRIQVHELIHQRLGHIAPTTVRRMSEMDTDKPHDGNVIKPPSTVKRIVNTKKTVTANSQKRLHPKTISPEEFFPDIQDVDKAGAPYAPKAFKVQELPEQEVVYNKQT